MQYNIALILALVASSIALPVQNARDILDDSELLPRSDGVELGRRAPIRSKTAIDIAQNVATVAKDAIEKVTAPPVRAGGSPFVKAATPIASVAKAATGAGSAISKLTADIPKLPSVGSDVKKAASILDQIPKDVFKDIKRT